MSDNFTLCAKSHLTKAETSRVMGWTQQSINNRARREQVDFWDRKTPLTLTQLTVRNNFLTALDHENETV